MRNRVIGSCLLAASLLFVGASSASAQDGGTTVSANYDFVYHEFNETSAAGAHFDVAKSVGVFDVVGEIGFNHFDGATTSSYSAGARWALPGSAKAAPFVQLLAGAWHCCDETDFHLQPGVGVDFATSSALTIRGQVDLRHIFLSDIDDENAVRASVGVVFNLGR